MRGKMLSRLCEKKQDIKLCVYTHTQYNHKYEKNVYIYLLHIEKYDRNI